MCSSDSGGEHWIQLNVGLVRRDGVALPAARALFDELAPLVEHWRSASKLRWFFFMRKPPDVRLRFRVAASDDLRSTLELAVAKLKRQGFISAFFYSAYEPETERFGGPEGLRSVHGYFDADTRTWLRLDALERQGRRCSTTEDLLPPLIGDLFQRAASGRPGLVAASWQSLAREIAIPSGGALPEVAQTTLDGLASSVGRGDEQECLAGYSRANEALARDLIELAAQRRLARPMPDVLAAVALFSLHRHGLSGVRSAPLVAGAMAALGFAPRR